MFRNAFKLPFRLFGIPILLDLTFLLVLPFMAWVIARNIGGYAQLLGLPFDPRLLADGSTPFLLGLVAAVGLFLSVLVHELGHALTAKAYGVGTRSITLWLLGGVAQLEDMPRQRGAEAVVAIAGPLTSVALAGLFWAAKAATPVESAATLFVFAYLAWTNLVLAIFNLLPALPLDGGRVLRSLLALKMSRVRATRVAAGVSKVLAVLLGIFGFLNGAIFMVLVAFFIYMAVTAETRQTVVADALEGLAVEELMTRDVRTVPPDLTVAELKQRMLDEHHLGFPVVNGRLVGMVTIHHLQNAPPDAQVADVMSRDLATISRRHSAVDALQNMTGNDSGRLIVVDESDRMIGILTRSDLMRAIMVHAAGGENGAAA